MRNIHGALVLSTIIGLGCVLCAAQTGQPSEGAQPAGQAQAAPTSTIAYRSAGNERAVGEVVRSDAHSRADAIDAADCARDGAAADQDDDEADRS